MPLDDRVVGGVEQQHQFPGRASCFEDVAGIGGVGVRQADAGEHHAERLAAGGGLGGDLTGQAAGAASRATRRPAASAREPAWSARRCTDTPVSTGSAGGSRWTGLSGSPLIGTCALARSPADRRRSVRRGRCTSGRARRSPTGMRSGSPLKRTSVLAGSIPAVPSSTWITARSRLTSNTSPCRSVPSAQGDRHEFVPAHPVDSGHHHQRSAQLRIPV